MKLVKLKCGTWINAEAVKRIQAHDPPIEQKDGTMLKARVGFLGEYDPWDTEETVEELAEIVLNAVGDPLVISDDGEILQPPPEPDIPTVTVGPGPDCDFKTFADLVDAFPTHDNRDGVCTVELKPVKKKEG